MSVLQSKPSLAAILGTFFALAACSGMTPGGGAPGEVGEPLRGVSSLDGGGSVGVGGPLGGSPLGGGGSSGEAVPSTQQSTDSIGAPCAIRFKASVKTLRHGVEESCAVSTARMRPDMVPAYDDTLAPPEESDNPTVTMTFSFQSGENPLLFTETRETECLEGRWRITQEFLFRYPSVDLVCVDYQVTAQARWKQEDKTFTGALFHGPPVPERDEDYAVPLELTLDLGGLPHPVHDAISPANSTLSL